LGEKSGAFDVHTSTDIAMMQLSKLNEYDAVVFNNTNSKPVHRNLFVDKLSEDELLDSMAVWTQAKALENNIITYIKNGGGLLIIHGGNTMLNNSMEFSKLIGGSFDYHPKQQNIHIKLVDPSHPLTQSLPASGFTHFDEPYFYKN